MQDTTYGISDNFAKFKNDIKLDYFQLDLAKRVLSQLDSIGQSGLEVMTSGGKSYIAAYIMSEYINKHRNGKVLWLAPKSAITNVREKILSKTALKNKIEYLGYEELSRGNSEVQDINDIKLIVFDECHKAYAKKTYENISSLLEKLGEVDRLAMSATPVRYGGINTFSILVPKVTEPIQFDLRDAAEHDLLPKVVYILANMSISTSDFKALENYKKLIKNSVEAEELYKEVCDTLNNFKFDLKTDLGELLKKNIKSNGDGGERHIAFFSSIASLKNMKSSVKAAFEEVYPNCIINILEYHSGLTEAENNNSFKQFVVDEPEPNRIDVLLSVDKATESIHPDNVRSVLMFRGTQSIRIYLQQMGRGIMLKSYHPEDVVIFDFASNVDCISGAHTIYRGRKAPGDRGTDITEYNDSIDDIRKAIMRQFGYSKGLATEIGLQRVKDSIAKLKEISKIHNIRATLAAISRVKKIYNSSTDEAGVTDTKNLYNMLAGIEFDSLRGYIPLRVNGFKTEEHLYVYLEKVKENFKRNQLTYLSDGAEINNELKKSFDSLGHLAYLTENNQPQVEQMLEDIDYLEAVVKKDGSIDNSSNTHAKHKLKQFRLDYIKELLPSNICIYARRHNVDIEMSNISISDLMSIADTEKEKQIVSEFRGVIRELNRIDSKIASGEDLSFEDWINSKVKVLVTYRKYRDSEMTGICMTYIYKNYGYILDSYRLSSTEVENGAKLLSAIMKIDAGEYPSRIEENYIFEHSGLINLSEYEQAILSEFGIGKIKYVSELENKTEFVQIYNKALSGDAESIKVMLGFNKDKLDAKRKKLLNTSVFKQIKEDVKDTIGAEILLKRAKLMCEKGGDYKKIRKELSDALESGIISHLDVALTPFRDYEYTIAKESLTCDIETFNDFKSNLAIVSPLSILITRCSQPTNCAKDIIGNIVMIKSLDNDVKYRLEEIARLSEL